MLSYGGRVNKCEDFAPNFGHKLTGCCHFLCSPIEQKTEGRHFDPIEVMEAVQDAF
jgi:hypothetical protein